VNGKTASNSFSCHRWGSRYLLISRRGEHIASKYGCCELEIVAADTSTAKPSGVGTGSEAGGIKISRRTVWILRHGINQLPLCLHLPFREFSIYMWATLDSSTRSRDKASSPLGMLGQACAWRSVTGPGQALLLLWFAKNRDSTGQVKRKTDRIDLTLDKRQGPPPQQVHNLTPRRWVVWYQRVDSWLARMFSIQ